MTDRQLHTESAARLEYVEATLSAITAEVLQIDREDLDLSRSFLSLGGDSILAIKMMARCRTEGITINVVDMIESENIKEMCQRAYAQSPDIAIDFEKKETIETQEVLHKLSHLQQLFAETGNTEARLLRLDATIQYSDLRSALLDIVKKHPILRAKLAKTETSDITLQWPDSEANRFTLELHTVDTDEEVTAKVLKLKSRIRRLGALVFAAILVEAPSGSNLLALAAHGSVMDAVSWGIVARELSSNLGCDTELAFHSRYYDERPIDGLWHTDNTPLVKTHYFENHHLIKLESSSASQTEVCSTTKLIVNKATTRLLLDRQEHPDIEASPSAKDILHAALVVAASTTTSLGVENIIFCDIYEDRSIVQSNNASDIIGCFDFVSKWSTSLFPANADAQLMGRMNWRRSGYNSFEDSAALQHYSAEMTPPAESTATTIILDTRYLESQFHGVEKMASQDEPTWLFSSTHESNSSRLSVALISTSNGIEGSFSADSKWYNSYDLEDFINVFKASLSGILRRQLQHKSCKGPVNISPPLKSNTPPPDTPSDNISSPSSSDISAPNASRNHRLEQIIEPNTSVSQSVIQCSTVQEAFLVSQSTNPTLYQCCYVLKFSGKHINAYQLGSAWRAVVKRHSILRTFLLSSSTRPGQFDQVVLNTHRFDPEITFHDWTHLPNPEKFSSREPILFQPSTVPHRVHLAQLSDDEVHMKLEVSHVLIDGQSTDVVIRDLCAAYRGVEITTPALPYGDFVAYQSQLPREESQTYWSKYLSEAQPTILPMDRGHEAPSCLETLNKRLEFDENSLSQFCDQYGVTLSNVCHVAWGLVLRTFTGSDNVTFSYTTSGRSAPLENLQKAIGAFVSTSICNMKFDAATSVEYMLKKVLKDYFEALTYPYTQDSSQSTSKSALQLGNTSLSFQRAFDMGASTESEIQVSVVEKSNPTDYDIVIQILAERNALDIDLDFWKSRIDPAHAKVVMKVFCQAIQWILQTPHGICTDVNLLGAEDKANLHTWNDEYPRAMQYCLHQKVEEIAQQQPEALAVQAWDGNLTYKELMNEASTLAYRLVELGVTLESMVGLCMDKSKWAVVSMLAILQAGGVVVPLGNSYPRPRIDGILADTAAKLLLVDQEQADRLTGLNNNTQLLIVDSTLLASLPSTVSVPNTGVTAKNAAWIIFTSGSTGTPKGVMLEHGSLSTSVKAHGQAFGTNHETRAAQFAAYTFDVSISDIWSTLHHGGCICIFSEHSRMNNLTEALQEFQVNYVNLTPTVLRLLDPINLPLVKTVVAGGEPLDPKLVETWAPHATVINSYGPSECSIISTCYSVSDPAESSVVGFPTATRLWVAETSNPNRLCPIGVPGELLIDGPLLSRGYLNDASKTAASFITDPSWAADLGIPSSTRFYRTGDLVRQNDNGSLTHLGRLDLQVKIRGQRVEIGEIEHWITSLLSNTRMVAVLITNQGQQNQQIGLATVVEFNKDSEHYDGETTGSLLVPTPELRKTFDELRASLFKVLPAYMVPNLYLPLSKMPLNPSSKLDRRIAKQMIESLDTESLQQYTTAQKTPISTKTEEQIQNLWSQALGTSKEHIGANDHFFQIGGDSVAAIRIVAAGRESDLNMHMTVADIFQHPQLSELAQFLDSRGGSRNILAEQADPAPLELWMEAADMQSDQVEKQLHHIADECGINRDQIEDVYPCTPLQEGMVAITARQPTAYMSHQVFSLTESINIDRFEKAWQEVIQSVPILRSRILFRPNSTSLQVVVRDISLWNHDSSLENYLSDSRTRIIGPGKPLNEFALIREAADKQFFVWISHHSTYDGWSRDLILERVANIYHNNAAPDTIPYARFIRYLSQTDSDAIKKYWQGQFQGEAFADFPSLPHAHYNPSPRHRIKHEFSLLKHVPTGVSMPDVLRAAWALVVSQHAGSTDPVFAVALSGRDAPVLDIANIVAPVITTVPVCIHIDNDQSVRVFLEAVREQRIGMIAYQHTGLQRIKKLLPGQESAFELRHMLVVQSMSQNDNSPRITGMEEMPVDMDEFDSYGLNVECSLTSSSVTLDVRFDENIIGRSHVERMLEQFALVTAQLCDPTKSQQRVGDLEFLSQKDLKMLKEWNNAVPFAVEKRIHLEVAEMASLQPQAIAVCAWDGDFTYADLLKQAATLSHHILQLGLDIRPETKIGLCMDKSKWAVVAMLAILQTGAAVVPLSESHPVARLEHIMSDAAAPLILIDQAQEERLHNLNIKLVTVDSTLLDSLDPVSQPPETEVRPENSAWVIFTSGSTGVPKGVVLEHKALVSSMKAHGKHFGLGPHSRVYQFAAHTFDVAISDCFTTLVWGGAICIPSKEDRMNNLAASMRSMEINFVTLTSTVARLIQPSEVPTLKTLVLGGEEAQAAVVEAWCKDADVLNVYGPAECSINSTSNGPIKDPSKASNIGIAMGTRLWVSQPSNPHQLCPIGITGELLIEGPQLARGYLNDAKKTADAFITNPAFALNPELGLPSNLRVYRTGDLVRQNEDGSLTYIGRRDTQVKIRGQRIDIKEIEHWISRNQQHGTGLSAVVVTHRDQDLPMLVAAIEMGADTNREILHAPTNTLREASEHIRASLAEILPAYMVPSIFVPVSRLPLNASAKLDRRATLALIDSIDTATLREYATATNTKSGAPKTEMERRLHDLWSTVLGFEVGDNDHFFKAGGDSVAAMRLVAAAKEVGLPLTVKDIFMFPRLQELAEAMEKIQDSGLGVVEETVIESEPFEMWKEAIGL